MDALDKMITKCKKDKSFKKGWDESKFEYELTRMIIKNRIESKMTQKELSKNSGIRQSNISRIENGECMPSLSTLVSLAKGMNRKLAINFI